MDGLGSLSAGMRAVIVGAAIASGALFVGYVAGAVYDGRIDPRDCPPACSSAVEAEEASSTALDAAAAATSPTPVPTEPASLPYVSAHSVAVLEASCGALMFGRAPHQQYSPASLTKLMTAVVALDNADPSTLITAHIDGQQLFDKTGSTIMGLKPGQQLSLLDLLYGLLLPSGNDAAVAIAEGIAGTQAQFVDMMNTKAKSLALDDTHFTNPHGLDDPKLHSSAYDMAVLARYVMQNPTLREIVSTVSWQPRWDGPPVWNGNRLITEYPGADGVKIGYTEKSAQTIVASATRGGRRIIVSLMYSQDRYSDAERLLDWAFAQPTTCP